MKHNIIWDKVQNCMNRDFAVLTKDLATYDCVHQSDKFGDNNIDLLRVFKKDKGHEHTIKSYNDLESHPELVLFKGHIFKDGSLYLSNKECGPDFENITIGKVVCCFPA